MYTYHTVFHGVTGSSEPATRSIIVKDALGDVLCALDSNHTVYPVQNVTRPDMLRIWRYYPKAKLSNPDNT